MGHGLGYAGPMLAQRLDNVHERPWRAAYLALPQGPEANVVLFQTATTARARLHVLRRRFEAGCGLGIEIATWLGPNRMYWVRPLRWTDGRVYGQVLHPARRVGPGPDLVWLRADDVVDWIVEYADGRVEGFFLQQQRRAIRRAWEKKKPGA